MTLGRPAVETRINLGSTAVFVRLLLSGTVLLVHLIIHLITIKWMHGHGICISSAAISKHVDELAILDVYHRRQRHLLFHTRPKCRLDLVQEEIMQPGRFGWKLDGIQIETDHTQIACGRSVRVFLSSTYCSVTITMQLHFSCFC